MIDTNMMLHQESKDFTKTKKIMTNIFKAYDAEIEIKQTDTYCNVDARMTATKKNKKHHYTVEIKERNVPSIEFLQALPLTVKKYCNIMGETRENETPLVIYLVNDEEYFIFNLNKLDLNNITIKNWNIPKVQFTSKQEYEQQPTFFIPLNQSIYNGIIN
ncbi:MAG: hypothetical protein II453_13025 [Alphaproteobacteria bacterium]|nr:hypothetical protein [Alphaproteobacteria bacterium]